MPTPTTTRTPGKTLIPDAEGFLTMHCPNCTEPIRFRPAYSELYAKGDEPAVPAEDAAAPEKEAVVHDTLWFGDRAAEIQWVRAFLDLDAHKLEAIETIRLIMSRTSCGTDGPIEKFIEGLVMRYKWAEDKGKGLTTEGVESELKELSENMADKLSEVAFIASRYSLPEVSNEETE